MTFETLPVNTTGPSYQDRSRPLSSQETRNFYPELVPGGKSEYALKSFPGQTEFSSAPAGLDNGMDVMKEVVYRVIDEVLYEVTSAGVHTSKGILGGSGRRIFANDGENLFIVSPSARIVNQFDGTTITQVTDLDIVGAKSVAFLNNQFIYTKDNLSVVSSVGDGASANGLDAVGAESSPDDLVRDYVFDQVIYRFGTRTTESWYNAGVGNPPIARIEGQIFSVGLASIHAATHTKDFIYWLGHDRRIYRSRGGAEEHVSSDAISHAIEGYPSIEGAFMTNAVFEGKAFVFITFPSTNNSFALVEEYGNNGWFEISTGKDEKRYNSNSMVYAYGKILVGHQTNGKLYRLDLENYTNDGELIQRRRVLAPINGGLLGQRGKRVQMSRFELILDAGVGAILGQGEDPKIMIEYSTDGAKSWGQGTWMRIGRLGETNVRAEWWSMISFYDLIIRITTTDPVDYSIYHGAIDVRFAGR